jgi:hypothetical protein
MQTEMKLEEKNGLLVELLLMIENNVTTKKASFIHN